MTDMTDDDIEPAPKPPDIEPWPVPGADVLPDDVKNGDADPDAPEAPDEAIVEDKEI